MNEKERIFDRSYFEPVTGEAHKSNYTRVGGYREWASSRNWMLLADLLTIGLHYGMTILDVGCAYGHLVQVLRQRGYEAWGIDVSPWALSQCQMDARPYVLLGDITKAVPVAPGLHYWNLICSVDVLEHLDSERSARRLLAEMANQAILQIHLVNTGEVSTTAFEGDASHKLRLTAEEWRELAREVCPMVQIIGTHELPKGVL